MVEEFETLTTARRLTAVWKDDYKGQRSHSSLGHVTPAEFSSYCAEIIFHKMVYFCTGS
ncbi:integrase core domain-containing protein [Gimesia chilikensis]|uniref:integrase core domain-containing protein n=1 Tax=Gimesia chilikensis TaxID=2605989 RepID=UPI003965652D